MKKILLITIIILTVTGCGKVDKKNIIKKLEKNINNSSYEMNGTMEIVNNEETFTYGLKVEAYKNKYFKVGLVNQTNNHEQVILKNDDGVYVITPALNKSFKFQSEWPNNGSQAYILESILKDLKNDQDYKVEENNNEFILQSKVNYPNNSTITYQKVFLDENLNIKEIKVYDINDSVKIKITVDKLKYKAKLTKDDFKLEDLITNDECTTSNCEETKASNIIDEIIYPLYVPSNTYLTSSEKIDTDNGNRVILTFGGDKDFILVEETSSASKEFEIIPIHGDPEMLSTSVAALSSNSIYFTVDNIEYYIASNTLNNEEMLNIASSLGNSVLVSKSK